MKAKKSKVATNISGYKGGRISRRVRVQPLGKKYTEIEIKGLKTNLIDFV